MDVPICLGVIKLLVFRGLCYILLAVQSQVECAVADHETQPVAKNKIAQSSDDASAVYAARAVSAFRTTCARRATTQHYTETSLLSAEDRRGPPVV